MYLKEMKTVLTVAGSDSSGGAGIQADLKTFAAHRVFGTSVITSITAQNSRGVRGTDDLSPDVVERQFRAVFEDPKPSAVKIGMLGNAEIVECVVRQLRRNRIRNLVVDPVIRSSSGKTLLSAKGVRALRDGLLPLARVVTPNLKEAEILSGIRIKTPGDRIKAARKILKTGVQSVLITGGHGKGRPVDLFYEGGRPRLLDADRLTREDLHGTGCVLSAAIASGLAVGKDLVDAIDSAKEFIGRAIAGGVRPGKGAPCVEPLAGLYQSEERLELFQKVSAAVEILKKERIGHLIPEVQSNLGVGLERVRTRDDVIGFPGRIVKFGEDIVTLAPPQFGASRHVADIVLTIMRYDPDKRAVMNIKYSGDLLNICKRLKYKIARFNRADEPRRVRKKEGASLEWGTDCAIRQYGAVPDIIYDLGGVGKEEMIRVIAEDIDSLVEKILAIHSRWKKLNKFEA